MKPARPLRKMKSVKAHANMRAAMRMFVFALLLIPLQLAAQGDLAQKKAELASLKARIQSIAAQVERDKQTQDSLSQDIERIEQRLASLREATRTVTRDLRAAETRSARLEAERKALQSELSGHYKALESQLRAAYIIGRQARTRMLLSQQDPARLARMQVYLEYFQRAYQERIMAFEATLTQLETKNKEAAQALNELKALKTSREQALAGIQTQRQQRQTLLDEVQSRLGAGGATLRDLRNQQARLEQLIEQLSAALKQTQLPSLSGNLANLKGQLFRPVEGPTLASYNSLKADGETRWKGLWLGADEGAPVRAVASGRVVYVDWMHHFGLLVIVDHGEGWFSLYGHNQTANKAVGDSVKAGESLAQAGNTGGHDKPGVYLEIRQGRKTHNPIRWLRAANP